MANEYTNKVVANNTTLIDLTSDTATAADVLEGRTLHLASGAPAVGTYRPGDEIEARLKATVGHSAKNLVSWKGYDDTLYNVHCFENNGYVRLVGTYNGDTVHQFFRNFFVLPAGSYVLSGGPSYVNDGIRTAMCKYSSSPANYETIGYDEGNGLSFTLPAATNCFVAYRFQSGAIGKPIDMTIPFMLRSADIYDDTFEPYVTPTDERIVQLRQDLATALAAKLDKPTVLYQAEESQASGSAVIANANCARYIVTALLETSNAVTFDVDADYIGKAYQGVNCGLSTSVSGDNLLFMMALHPGSSFSSVKLVKIVGIPS